MLLLTTGVEPGLGGGKPGGPDLHHVRVLRHLAVQLSGPHRLPRTGAQVLP